MPEQHHLPEEKLPFQKWKLEKFSEAAVSGTTKIKASDRKSIYGNDSFSKL
jgi:hypothetical protein